MKSIYKVIQMLILIVLKFFYFDIALSPCEESNQWQKRRDVELFEVRNYIYKEHKVAPQLIIIHA